MRRIFQYCLFFLLIVASIQVVAQTSSLGDQELDSQLLGLLPKQGELSNWQKVSEPRFFGPDNLYDYIDGAADHYLLYGFRKVITVEYLMVSDSCSVTLEIYNMKSPLHAFGIYASERSPKVQPLSVGVQGYIVANVLVFYKGLYYIKITTFTSSKDLSAPLMEMGKSIDDKIPGEFKETEMFGFFPEENRIRNSERFIPADFLGQSYLKNAYLCDYSSGRETYQIFLIPLDSDTTGQSILKKYKLFLESQNYRIKLQNGEKVMIAEKGSSNLLFTFRSFFCGVLNIKSLNNGQAVVEAMRKNLSKK